jgi:predicted nucleic acid-binding protein
VKYLIDSDWVIDGIARVPVVQPSLYELAKEGIAVSIVTVGEVFEGAFSATDPQHELQVFRRYLTAFAIIPLTDPIMENFAGIPSTLRRQGRLIPDIDLQIAATAVTLDLTLITRNVRHFARVPNLKLYDGGGQAPRPVTQS